MNNVNFARSVLILIVVLGHSIIFWAGNWIFDDIKIEAPLLGQISGWFGTFHTQALTVISGFTYEFVVESRGGYLFPELVKKKLKRLLIPFVLISIFWVLPLTSFVIEIDANYILNKFVLGKSPAQLWYLLMLFDVFVLFYPIRYLLSKSGVFYIIFPILYFAADFFGDTSNNYFQFITSLRYLSFFALGHVIFRYRKVLFSNGPLSLRKPVVLIMLVIIHIIAYITYLLDIPRTKTLLMLFLNFGGALTAAVVLLHIGEKVNPNNKLMSILNNNSFGVYLLHQQLIYYTLFTLNGLINPYLHAVINFAVSLSLSLIISVAFHRSRILRVYFLGEKK